MIYYFSISFFFRFCSRQNDLLLGKQKTKSFRDQIKKNKFFEDQNITLLEKYYCRKTKAQLSKSPNSLKKKEREAQLLTKSKLYNKNKSKILIL